MHWFLLFSFKCLINIKVVPVGIPHKAEAQAPAESCTAAAATAAAPRDTGRAGGLGTLLRGIGQDSRGSRETNQQQESSRSGTATSRDISLLTALNTQ